MLGMPSAMPGITTTTTNPNAWRGLVEQPKLTNMAHHLRQSAWHLRIHFLSPPDHGLIRR